jgi:hypothetical protein
MVNMAVVNALRGVVRAPHARKASSLIPTLLAGVAGGSMPSTESRGGRGAAGVGSVGGVGLRNFTALAPWPDSPLRLRIRLRRVLLPWWLPRMRNGRTG